MVTLPPSGGAACELALRNPELDVNYKTVQKFKENFCYSIFNVPHSRHPTKLLKLKLRKIKFFTFNCIHEQPPREESLTSDRS